MEKKPLADAMAKNSKDQELMSNGQEVDVVGVVVVVVVVVEREEVIEEVVEMILALNVEKEDISLAIVEIVAVREGIAEEETEIGEVAAVDVMIVASNAVKVDISLAIAERGEVEVEVEVGEDDQDQDHVLDQALHADAATEKAGIAREVNHEVDLQDEVQMDVKIHPRKLARVQFEADLLLQKMTDHE